MEDIKEVICYEISADNEHWLRTAVYCDNELVQLSFKNVGDVAYQYSRVRTIYITSKVKLETLLQ